MTRFSIQCRDSVLELGPKTCIMGILNTTPDSFSDGGRFHSFDAAVAQGLKLVDDGAQVIDIGGESSRPFAAPVSEEEELNRVIPVIEQLAKKTSVPISIDTVKSGVAKAALDAGASIINDISAFERDPAMADLAAQVGAPVILMHMKGTPETMQVNPDYDDLMLEITTYLNERAQFAIQKGIKKEQIILDPGIGFGKTVEHNLVIMNHINRIADLGYPLLVGPSRKSFIQRILTRKQNREITSDSEKTEYGTLAAVGASVIKGSHIVRVHDVEKARSFIDILDSIRNA